MCTQVTRHNFDAAAQNIKEALEECDFVAFDCEMTGLFLDNNEGSYLDDMPLRYYKVLPSAITSTKYPRLKEATAPAPSLAHLNIAFCVTVAAHALARRWLARLLQRGCSHSHSPLDTHTVLRRIHGYRPDHHCRMFSTLACPWPGKQPLLPTTHNACTRCLPSPTASRTRALVRHHLPPSWHTQAIACHTNHVRT